MDKDSLPELLKEHYSNSRLPEARVSGILETCEVARSAYQWRQRACVAAGLTVTALLAMLASLTGMLGPKHSTTPVFGTSYPTSPGHASGHLFPARQLVAAMVHANGCASSKAVEPVFAQLQEQFINEPVLFLTFDVGSECALRQAELLSASLGIEDAFRQHRSTGRILLISASGKLCDIVDQEKPLTAAAASVRHGLNLSGF